LARLRQPDPITPFSIHRATGGLLVNSRYFHPVSLRDACTCSQCVDPSSTQKNFQTTDIPSTIRIKSLETLGDGGEIRVRWRDDIPGFGEDHVTVFAEGALDFSGSNSVVRDRTRISGALLWDTAKIKKKLEFVNFDDYMASDKSLWRALWLLSTQGLMIVRNVPESEKSVEDIALRIGSIRDSLYGRTWDVKSVPDAKNVAYTAKHLGLHMDLLYMANPPGFQFLHCLKSTAKGGASLFADAFHAAKKLHDGQQAFLAHTPIAYHYKNAGEHYYHTHHVIELERKDRARGRATEPAKIRYMNYSPPFQANYLLPHTKNATETEGFLNALRAFTEQTQREENLLEYRLQEGECVIFNNRRILHGRKQFDALGGERWLKGTYVDTDVVNSRYRVLEKQFDSEINTPGDDIAQRVFEQEAVEDQADPNGPALAAATG
jgi:alpha-ketoglutarate-dependent taurine dioxygenase